jgi:hypothetical protein
MSYFHNSTNSFSETNYVTLCAQRSAFHFLCKHIQTNSCNLLSPNIQPAWERLEGALPEARHFFRFKKLFPIMAIDGIE